LSKEKFLPERPLPAVAATGKKKGEGRTPWKGVQGKGPDYFGDSAIEAGAVVTGGEKSLAPCKEEKTTTESRKRREGK